MSAVPCLPACLWVSAAATRGQAPHGNASKAFHRREATHPSRATRGRVNPEYHGLRSNAQSIAPSTSSSAESVEEVWRPELRPVPATLAAASPTSTAEPQPPAPNRPVAGTTPATPPLATSLKSPSKTKAKPRQLHLRKSGPSSDVESAHWGRRPTEEASCSSSVAHDQRNVTCACQRA